MKFSMLPALVCLLMNCAIAAEYKVETVAGDLSYPWAMAFLPGGDILVTERSGQLQHISGTGERLGAVNGIPEVYVAGQGGLLDVILHPAFATNHTVFLSFAHGTADANALRVISAELIDGALQNVRVLFTAKPFKDTANHYAGRLALLPDQTLLISVGEGFDYREKAQFLDNHFGKLVRINLDGSVPGDNPFIDRTGAMPEIWTYGHRNPQGLLVAADGTVWLHEHGPRGGDELNEIQPGNNYGWPAITHGVDYSGAYVSPFTEAEGMQQPVAYWVPSIAPAGFCEYTGSAFPEWQGNLLLANLAERSVRRLVLGEGGVMSQQALFRELGQRIREVGQGPDGAIYLLTDSSQGELLRVMPAN